MIEKLPIFMRQCWACSHAPALPIEGRGCSEGRRFGKYVAYGQPRTMPCPDFWPGDDTHCDQFAKEMYAAAGGRGRPQDKDAGSLLDAFDKIQAECRAKFIERQDQHGSMSIEEMGLDDLMGVLKLKWARTKQQVHEGIQRDVFIDDLRDMAIYCHIVELKYTGDWNLPWKGASR